VPLRCENCISLERQLRDVEIEIEAGVDRRDSGLDSGEEQQAVEQFLADKLTFFHQTKLIYDLHKRRSHR
jgi:hypothetical protein